MRMALAILTAALVSSAVAPGAYSGDLRLNQMQVIGSHNSYRPFPDAATIARLKMLAGNKRWLGLEYGHPPLADQLDLGLRQLELDPAPDPHGGLYAQPYANDPATFAAMMMPGAKVLHIPVADTATHCLTFRDCLQQLSDWSAGHPGHTPVFVTVNARDFGPDMAHPGLWGAGAVFDAAGLDGLDADIRAVFPAGRIFTPDEVRGDAAMLSDAVKLNGWPRVEALKGRFIFVLDGDPAHYDAYRRGHPSLRGRAMFGFYGADAAEAAILKYEDPIKDGATIKALVKQGFIIRTRSDADTMEARKGDATRFQAAIASGAHIISTDYYTGAPNPRGFHLRVHFDGGQFKRCDPVTTRCSGR